MREKHRKITRGVKFYYVGIWRDFTHYERKLLGIKQWYQITIDWTDAMLNELFDSNYFKSMKEEIQNWQKLEQYQRPEAIPKEYYEVDENSPDIEVLKSLPYTSFKIDDITKDIKEDLKKYKIHIGILYEPESYEDTDIEFDRICLMTDTDIEKSLATKQSFALHEGYPVEIDQCECAFAQLGFILPEIPTFLLTWSENITKKVLESALDTRSVHYIELKVLEKFVYTLRAFAQQAAMSIEQERTKSNMYFDAWDDILQEIEEIDIRKVLGSKELQVAKLEAEAQKYEKSKMLNYAMIAIVVILLFIIIFVLATIGGKPPSNGGNGGPIEISIIRTFLKFFIS